MNAQFSDLQAKHDAERAVSKELGRDNKELSQENEVLKARLTAADAVADAIRNRHSAIVDVWTHGQVLRYNDSGFKWSDLNTQYWALRIWFSYLVAMVSMAWGVSWLWFLGYTLVIWFHLFTLVPLLAYSVYYDAVGFAYGIRDGGIFRSYATWEYAFVRTFEHVHGDDRTDNNALQNIKHAPRYAEFLLKKGINFGFKTLFSLNHQYVIVSMELYVQICNPKNLDPFLTPTEARSAFQRSAAHNHTVSIDRNLIIRGSFVYQETVCLAFFAYLRLKESWKNRDFLPALPH